MYHRIVRLTASALAEKVGASRTEQDRIRYGFELLLSSLLTFSVCLIVAVVLGSHQVVFFMLVSSGVLKPISGGLHLKEVWECTLFTTLIFNLLGYCVWLLRELILLYWQPVLGLLVLFAGISFILYSPGKVPNKTISDKKRSEFKIVSIAVVCALLLIPVITFWRYGDRVLAVNLGLMAGVFWQSVAVNPLMYSIRDFYYHIRDSYYHMKGGNKDA